MKIKDNELKAILAEVEAEVVDLLKSEKVAKLAKAAPPEESSGGEASAGGESAGGDAGGGSAPPEASGGAPAGAPPAGAAPAAPAAPMGAPADASAAPADPAAAGADAGAPASPEELVQEYLKLPPEELKAHYLAAKAALFQVMGSADGAGAAGAGASPAGAPPAGPGASPAPMGAGAPGAPGDVPPAPPMGKAAMPYAGKNTAVDEHASDGDPTPTGTGQTKPLITAKKAAMPYAGKNSAVDEHASDSDPTPTGTGDSKKLITEKKSEKNELEDLRKGQEMLAGLLEKMISQPQRKAVTGLGSGFEIEWIKKSETPAKAEKPLRKSVDEMTMPEVHVKLREITASPKLAKSDRKLVNDFYDNKIGLDGIKHLLAEAQ